MTTWVSVLDDRERTETPDDEYVDSASLGTGLGYTPINKAGDNGIGSLNLGSNTLTAAVVTGLTNPPAAGSNATSKDYVDGLITTPDAADVVFTPVGGLSADDVQAALAELDSEKEAAGTAASTVATQSADTTSVHGIADTSALETVSGAASQISTHSSDTTSVHGISDTSALETTSGAQTKANAAQAAAIAASVPVTYLDTDTSLAANSDAKVATQKATKAWATAQAAAAQAAAIAASVPVTYLDTDTALTANSDAKVATQKATKAYAAAQAAAAQAAAIAASVPITYLDTDNTLAANSDVKVASQKAEKAYVDRSRNFQPGVLVNGSFGIWERGNGPFTANAAYTANSWYIELGSGGSISVSKATGSSAASAFCLEATYTHGSAETRVTSKYEDWSQTRGRVVTFRAKVKASVASGVRLKVTDGVAPTYSSYHTGGGGWETLVVTFTPDASSTTLEVSLAMGAGSSAVYSLDSADLMIGDVAASATIPAYWSADPAIERVRTQKYYSEMPVEFSWDAVGNNESRTFQLFWPRWMFVAPTITVKTTGTRTNLTGTPTYTAVDKQGGKVTLVSAVPGTVTVTGEVLALVANIT